MKSLFKLLLCFLITNSAFAQNLYQPFPAGIGGYLQFSDNKGLPIALGFVCLTASGTTNNLATFSTPNGTANVNPVALDASGRASIYLQPLAYTVKLYSQGVGNVCNNVVVGALIESQDNVLDTAGLILSGNVTLAGTDTFTGAVTATTLNNRQLCVPGGANFGAEFVTAAALIPATGGIVDCSNLQGPQNPGASDPFTGITKPITLIWPTGTVSSAINLSFPANLNIEFSSGSALSMAVGQTATLAGSYNCPTGNCFIGAGSFSSLPILHSGYPAISLWQAANGTGTTRLFGLAAAVTATSGGTGVLSSGETVGFFSAAERSGSATATQGRPIWALNTAVQVDAGQNTNGAFSIEADVNNRSGTDALITASAKDQMIGVSVQSGGTNKPLAAFVCQSSAANNYWQMCADLANYATFGLRITQPSTVTGEAVILIPGTSVAGASMFTIATTSGGGGNTSLFTIDDNGNAYWTNNVQARFRNAALNGFAQIFMGGDDEFRIRAGPSNNIQFELNNGSPIFASLSGGLWLQSATPVVGGSTVGIGATTSGSVSNGAGVATPANVAGFWVINVAGTVMKVPYYPNFYHPPIAEPYLNYYHPPLHEAIN